MTVSRAVGAEAERIIRTCVVLGRFGALVQLCVGFTEAVTLSPRPALAACVGVAAIIEMTTVCLWCWKRRAYLPLRWIRVDLLVFVAAVVAEHWTTRPQYLAGSWVGWATGTLMASIWASSCYLPVIELACSVVSASTVALVVSLPGVGAGSAASIYISTFVMVGLPAIFRLVSSYIRRVAADADVQYALAAAAARRAELDEHRLLVHDSASILRLFASDDLEPQLRQMLRTQADAEADKISSFLADARSLLEAPASAARATEAVPLRSPVLSATTGFGELPLLIDIDQTAAVKISPTTAAALERALTAILHNVRLHSSASTVTIHTVVTKGGWLLIVSDDGTGFDPRTSSPGFGLRSQIVGALAEHRLTVGLHSGSGAGTTVVVMAHTGPAETVSAF